MRTIFVLLSILLFSLAAFAFVSAQSQEAIQIKTNAKCGICKKTLETQLPRYGGIGKVTLDVKSKVLTVAYNPRKTSPEKIRQAVNNIGYDADDKIAPAAAQARLKPCCRKDAAVRED